LGEAPTGSRAARFDLQRNVYTAFTDKAFKMPWIIHSSIRVWQALIIISERKIWCRLDELFRFKSISNPLSKCAIRCWLNNIIFKIKTQNLLFESLINSTNTLCLFVNCLNRVHVIALLIVLSKTELLNQR
jgi:hypothetical protein